MVNNKNKKNKTPTNNNSIKLKQNINNNSKTKKTFQNKAYNYTQIYLNRPKLKKEKIKEIDITINTKDIYKEKNNIISYRKFIINEYNKIDIETKKKLINNKDIKIKVLTKNSSSKKLNLGIFEKILIDLKSIKSAANRNNKKILYNVLNPENRLEIMSENNNQGLFSKLNESKFSSGPISNDLNDINSSRISTNRIQIQETYNLVKNCIDKKNKHFQKNYINSNINLMKDNNNILIPEKVNSENEGKNNNKKEIKKEIYSESNSQNNISDNKEIEEKNETDKNIIINNTKNFNIKNAKNTNNTNNYLIDIFESRKRYLINNESRQEDQRNNIYKRGQMFKAKTDLKIEKLRKKLLDKENSELTNTPKINNKSKKLTKYNLPIYERLNEIEKKKQSDIQRIKNLIIIENDIDENTINQKNGKNFNKKNFDKWLKRNNNWYRQKKNKIEKIKDKLNKEEFNNKSFTFIPKIDDNSERIFNKNQKLSKSPVVERLFNKSKTKILKNEESKKFPKFIPNINKEYQISREYFNFMEENQVELYNKLIHNKIK